MGTVAQVLNREQVPPSPFYVGTMTAAGPPMTVNIGFNTLVPVLRVGPDSYAVGDSVLVLLTPSGYFALGKITA